MFIIQPFLLSKINIYISKGYKLCDILEEYGSGEFESEIIACYYHINNGPDLREYQKETLEEAHEDGALKQAFFELPDVQQSELRDFANELKRTS